MVSILFAMEVKGISSIKATKASLLLSLTSLSDNCHYWCSWPGWGTDTGGQNYHIIQVTRWDLCVAKL